MGRYILGIERRNDCARMRKKQIANWYTERIRDAIRVLPENTCNRA